eukprot:Pgem_evm1s8801
MITRSIPSLFVLVQVGQNEFPSEVVDLLNLKTPNAVVLETNVKNVLEMVNKLCNENNRRKTTTQALIFPTFDFPDFNIILSEITKVEDEILI